MYVSQGYSVDTVAAQLLPAQLIPGVLEPIGMMYGIAFVLIAAGVMNNKLSKVLEMSAEAPVSILPETDVEEEADETAEAQVVESAKETEADPVAEAETAEAAPAEEAETKEEETNAV